MRGEASTVSTWARETYRSRPSTDRAASGAPTKTVPDFSLRRTRRCRLTWRAGSFDGENSGNQPLPSTVGRTERGSARAIRSWPARQQNSSRWDTGSLLGSDLIAIDTAGLTTRRLCDLRATPGCAAMFDVCVPHRRWNVWDSRTLTSPTGPAAAPRVGNLRRMHRSHCL
jgi:hypothetical protein